MTTGKALNGKPYAGNPHVRFDEGEVASAAMPRRGSLLYNINKMITFAAVAASAAIPMAANAATSITTTINGVEWRFILDTPTGTKGSAMLGINTSTSGTTGRANYELHGCPQDVSVNAADIPWEFDYDGVHYTVTKVAQGAFFNTANMTGVLTIPPAVTEIRNCAFQNCTGLTGLRGGDSVTFWGTSAFNGCPQMHGAYPDLSAATYFGEEVFRVAPLTGTLKLGDSLATISLHAFQGCNFTGSAIIPSSVNSMGSNSDYGVFQDSPNLSAIWVKGKPDAASQSYLTVYCAKLAASCQSMKMVLMGKNTKGGRMARTGSSAMLYGVTGVQVFVPANGYWDGLVTGGTDNKVWYYGPTGEFDLEINHEWMQATITPTTVNALTNALAWVPAFKTHSNLDAHISVTNTIDLTDVTITEDMTSGVTFDRLVFSAKTQTQLDAILGAFPATTPISIDPTGLTENMTIPDGYPNVFVKTVPGVTIRRTASGFIIIVK